jgi:hypothetical protein
MNPEEPLGTLTSDDILVLFEWAHRFCETGKLAFSHHAEVVVIDKVAGDLERVLEEPFRSSYPTDLNAARIRVLEAYEARMGQNTWIHEQPLNQS